MWPAVIRRPRQSESFATGDQESITTRRVQVLGAARQASREAAIVPEAAALYEKGARWRPLSRFGPVAQWLEPAAHNGLVGGSNPPGPTNDFNMLQSVSLRRLIVGQ